MKPLLELDMFSLGTLFSQMTQSCVRVQSLESGVTSVEWIPASTGTSSTGYLFIGLKLHTPQCHPWGEISALMKPDLRRAVSPVPGRHCLHPETLI